MEPIEPDEEAYRNVEHDYPNEPPAEKYRLAQADTLIRLSGGMRQKDGSYVTTEMKKKSTLYRTAVEEAQFRLDLVLQLIGAGDDLPSPLYDALISYREKLQDFLHDPANTPNPFDSLFHRHRQ